MKHTALPWYVECFGEDDIINIRARPEKGLATHIVYMDYNSEETKANAAFIVKACNNHEILLAALKELYENCEAAGKYLDKAHKAIKQAEGKQ